MQPNIPLGARHNHTALKVENNQSRRRPTSWSLWKILDSGLYLYLLSRGRTFLLASPETDGPIILKSKEKIEPLSLLSSSLPFPFSLFPFLSFPLSSLPIELFGLKSSGMSSLATCHYPIVSLGFPYHFIHLPWISLQSCVTCLLWVPLELFV